MEWITALRAPAIAKLARDDGPLQMSLFDTQNFAEITHPDYPGERLVCCHNPVLAAERARKREDLLAATENELAKIQGRAAAGRLKDQDKIGIRVGKVINKRKVGKHFITEVTGTSFTWRRDQDKIAAEAALDGIYVIRTSVTGGHPRRRRRDHRLQGPQVRRAGLPHHQGRRPGPAAHPPLPRPAGSAATC